ncbi:MAG: PepSY domain-containing protein [Proteobacteria bacterium]|nr:PepSY domain-containing protein [Pseudomonadota bacterium]
MGGVGFAASAHDSDPPAMAAAGIGMSQAVTAAEQHAGGKAARAEFEKSEGQWVYDVEVVNGTKAYDVKVNAAKGSVISATEDKEDTDEHSDAED